MADFSTYIVRDSRPVGGLNDVVTIGLGPGVIGGQLNISGAFVGTLSFTSDPGIGTYAAQTLTSLSGAAGSTFVATVPGVGAGFLIPTGIVGLKVTMTSFTSGVAGVSWSYSAYNTPPDHDLRAARAGRRQAILNDSLGYYTETMPRTAINGATIMVSGTVYYMSIPLLQGDPVNAYKLENTVAGNTFTGVGVKLGLYLPITAGTAGTLLSGSVTGDVSGTAGAAGPVSGSPVATYFAPGDGLYYAAVICVATTPPTSSRGPALGGAVSGAFASGTVGRAGHQTGQTDLPAAAALTFSSSSLPFWVGIA